MLMIILGNKENLILILDTFKLFIFNIFFYDILNLKRKKLIEDKKFLKKNSNKNTYYKHFESQYISNHTSIISTHFSMIIESKSQ